MSHSGKEHPGHSALPSLLRMERHSRQTGYDLVAGPTMLGLEGKPVGFFSL